MNMSVAIHPLLPQQNDRSLITSGANGNLHSKHGSFVFFSAGAHILSCCRVEVLPTADYRPQPDILRGVECQKPVV